MKEPQPAGPKAQFDRKKFNVIKVGNAKKRAKRGAKGPSFKKILDNLLTPLVDAFEEFTYNFPSIEEVVKTSILACVETISIDAVCQNIDTSLTARTVRHYLGCLQKEKVEKGVNQLLRSKVIDLVKDKWVRLAADFVQLPYYGDPYRDENELMTGAAKKGTMTFHSYFTVYAVVRNQRYTIAIRHVKKNELKHEIFRDTIDEILGLGLNIKVILLDKEFYQVGIINYLKERELPAIIAAALWGKKIKELRVRRKGSRSVPWKLKRGKARFTLQCYLKYTKGSKVQGGGATWLFYATVNIKEDPRRTSKIYRRRFGIESSYRMMNGCRARTSSRNPEIRLFFVLIALMIVNLKVLLEWLSIKDGRISREESTRLMRMTTLTRLIRITLEDWLMRRCRRKTRHYEVR